MADPLLFSCNGCDTRRHAETTFCASCEEVTGAYAWTDEDEWASRRPDRRYWADLTTQECVLAGVGLLPGVNRDHVFTTPTRLVDDAAEAQVRRAA